MKDKIKKKCKQEEKQLITFLKQTRSGEYAKVDISSLRCIRLKEQREPYYEDEYYYSYR